MFRRPFVRSVKETERDKGCDVRFVNSATANSEFRTVRLKAPFFWDMDG